MESREIKIPDFLRRENEKPLSKEDKTFFRLYEEYKKKFNADFSTSGFSYSSHTEIWIALMEYCINHNVLMEEITGESLT